MDLTWVARSGRDVPSKDGLQQVVQFDSHIIGAGLRLRVCPELARRTASVQIESAQASLRCELDPRTGLYNVPSNDPWKGKAGTLTATARDDKSRILARADLCIRPANLEPSELQAMMDDIAACATSSMTWVQYRVPTSEGGSSGDLDVAAAPVMTFRSYELAELLVEALERHLPQLNRRPLSALRRTPEVIRAHRAGRTRSASLALARRPGRRHVVHRGLSEHQNCTENQLLRHIVEAELLPLLEVMQGHCDARHRVASAEERCAMEALADPGLRMEEDEDRAVDAHRARSAQNERTTSWLQQATRSLRGLLELPVLARVGRATTPIVTERARGTDGYAQIVRAYEAWKQACPSARYRTPAALSHTLREVAATWQCYEVWCVLQLIEAFVRKANMQPASPDSVVANLVQDDGTLPASFRIHLRRHDGDVFIRRTPRIPSSRDSSGGLARRSVHLTPDIVVTTRLHSTRGAVVERHFVFDAKYHDYRNPKRSAGCIVEDVVKTALLKYDAGFREMKSEPEGLAPSGSFILHPTLGVDYWGGESLQTFLQRSSKACKPKWRMQANKAKAWSVTPPTNRNRQHGGPESFQVADELMSRRDHRTGAIHLRPGNHAATQRQLDRLVDLVLHLPETRDKEHGREAIRCPRCGKTLRKGHDIKLRNPDMVTRDADHAAHVDLILKNRLTLDFVCRCPTCPDHVWWLRRCTCARFLVKRGNLTIHTRQAGATDQAWHYQCPYEDHDPPA